MTDPALCPPLSGGGVRPRPGGFDLSRRLRALVALIALGMSALALAAVLRALAGAAPHHPNIREVATLVHVVAVLPAIPLGGYLLLARKGTARHRALGSVWAGLMVVTALSAMFIGQRHGELHLSPLQLFVPLTLLASWKLVAAARRGDMKTHRKEVLVLFLGALTIPGLVAFLMPGRMMATWLWG
ncbi:DUF2306 domain-containing protein [Erythrobacter sp. HL-111]|uniref:DUF2306 domain-containing protein n=1 Tax=Erythrobacter sp. HL-111 TaxID=1798193 RepID=UPI0006DAC845|nr:DUF2306 domain-containing protein [Erythrobacter sp. HL-111]KPP94326.1 MAG: putative membrane protein [Erythrobacteraceae bacterium HL-111]SDS50749.1 Uncharacterized membrane protein [Erythrobacter sp. HL-111]